MRRLTYFFLGLALVACGGGGGGGGGSADSGEGTSAATTVTVSPGAVLIRWQPNRESAVNRAGGGYRVYRGGTSAFDPATDTVLDVPHPAPPQAVLNLTPGTYYIRVTAYSDLNPVGSAASPVTKLVVSNP